MPQDTQNPFGRHAIPARTPHAQAASDSNLPMRIRGRAESSHRTSESPSSGLLCLSCIDRHRMCFSMDLLESFLTPHIHSAPCQAKGQTSRTSNAHCASEPAGRPAGRPSSRPPRRGPGRICGGYLPAGGSAPGGLEGGGEGGQRASGGRAGPARAAAHSPLRRAATTGSRPPAHRRSRDGPTRKPAGTADSALFRLSVSASLPPSLCRSLPPSIPPPPPPPLPLLLPLSPQ